MMQIEGLENVIHRIDELNQRFGLATSPYNRHLEKPEAVQKMQGAQETVQGSSFASELSGAMKAAGVTMPGDTNSMIAAAASLGSTLYFLAARSLSGCRRRCPRC